MLAVTYKVRPKKQLLSKHNIPLMKSVMIDCKSVATRQTACDVCCVHRGGAHFKFSHFQFFKLFGNLKSRNNISRRARNVRAADIS